MGDGDGRIISIRVVWCGVDKAGREDPVRVELTLSANLMWFVYPCSKKTKAPSMCLCLHGSETCCRVLGLAL